MKIKFVVLTLLLLTARGCDWYTTVLATKDLADEVNPLVTVLGMGWWGLAIINALLVAGIIGLAYFQIHAYRKKSLSERPAHVFQYISACYYNRMDRFYWVFYKSPKDKKPFMGHLGFSLIRTMIVISFMAAIHNYCSWHQIEAYATFKSWIGSPVKFILTTGVLMAFGFSLFIAHREFKDLPQSLNAQ